MQAHEGCGKDLPRRMGQYHSKVPGQASLHLFRQAFLGENAAFILLLQRTAVSCIAGKERLATRFASA